MYWDNSGSKPQNTRSGIVNRVSNYWRLVWIVALALGGLVTGAIVAAQTAIPNWHGSTPKSISGNLPILSWQPAIASDPSSELLVAAWSNPPSQGELRNIYTAHSTDNGRSWTDPLAISTTMTDSLKPDVAIAQGQIFVTWAEGNPPIAIYEAERTLSTSWETYTIPSSSALDGNTWPHIATRAEKLHVVFTDENTDILYAMRPVTASTWMTATAVYTHTGSSQQSSCPVLAVAPDGQTLHLAWQEYIYHPLPLDSEKVIMYMRGQVSGDGVVWDPAEIISSQGQEMIEPDVAVDSLGNVHVTWGEKGEGGNEEQYIRYTHDTGGSWMTPTLRIDPTPIRVHDQSPYFVTPDMSLWEDGDEMMICVAWHGYRIITGEETVEEVLLGCSQDRGNSWSLPQNVSRSPLDSVTLSINPSIAFDLNGHVQVVWQEYAGEDIQWDYKIYHSHAQNLVFMPLIMRNG